ncbi:MAG: hypothetical protein HC852_04100 [Acaryochloridaceae cyanobacterium RU_4_10]|nr:hypothetical protein [Acaryochloridaceae cyanobacterium RU_4_10]
MQVEELRSHYQSGRRNFQGVDLQGVNLAWADLAGIDLRDANVRGVNFSAANLKTANCQGANFSFTDLSRADLTHANLQGTNLEGATLDGVQWEGIVYDDTTQFPKGFNPPSLEKVSVKDAGRAIAYPESTPSLSSDSTPSNPKPSSTPAPIDVDWVDSRSPVPATTAKPKPATLTWNCVQALKAHKSSVNALALSSDGNWLASGSDDRALYLWDLNTGRYTFSFLGQSKEVTSVAISPNNQIIASGCFDQKVTAWNLDTRRYCGPLCKTDPLSVITVPSMPLFLPPPETNSLVVEPINPSKSGVSKLEI